MFTQMTSKQGIKTFGEKAVAAMLKEPKPLDEGAMAGKPVIQPMHVNILTREDRRGALNAINLIKEKRDATIKERICDDGGRQKANMKEG